MRIVSVLPSATEIVHALGHGRELVGRSAECDYPPAVLDLPVVMRARTLDADRPSREIDARVQQARARKESLYELDIELLRCLAPDLLLTQDLCGVCSVTEREVEEALRRASLAPKVVSLTPRRLDEVWASIGVIARALGDPGAADPLLERLRSVSAEPSGEKRVAVVEWLDPPILAGLWTPDIVGQAGGIPVGPAPGSPGQRTTWEELAREEIDLLVLSPCSFSVERTRRELEDPRVRAGVEGVPAPRGVFVADEAYFSRPGPRLADGVGLVRDLLRGSLERPPMPVYPWVPARQGAAA